MVKPNKLASQQRKSEILRRKPQPKPSKGQNDRKVHAPSTVSTRRVGESNTAPG